MWGAICYNIRFVKGFNSYSEVLKWGFTVLFWVQRSLPKCLQFTDCKMSYFLNFSLVFSLCLYYSVWDINVQAECVLETCKFLVMEIQYVLSLCTHTIGPNNLHKQQSSSIIHYIQITRSQ